jgi:hypothetical protein
MGNRLGKRLVQGMAQCNSSVFVLSTAGGVWKGFFLSLQVSALLWHWELS